MCESFINSDHSEIMDKSPITVDASGTIHENTAAKTTAAIIPYK